MEEKHYSIPGTLLQEVVNYLQARPFVEVASVLGKLGVLINAQNEPVKAPSEGSTGAEGK